MTRLWKRKTHEYLIALTVLLLAQTCWTVDEDDSRKLKSSPTILNENVLTGGSYVEIVVGTTADAATLQYYLTHWNYSSDDTAKRDNVTQYVEGLPDVLFHSSAENHSLIFSDLSRCMNDFRFVTCLKLLLVNRLDNFLDYLKENNATDLSFGNGFVTFKSAPGVNNYEDREAENDHPLGLDEDISRKVMQVFKDRSLHVKLVAGIGLDVEPVPANSPEELVGFKVRPYFKLWKNDEKTEGRSGGGGNKRKKSKGGFNMPPMMIMPSLIMWGFMPFALANLQAMVMNAFMLNMMALNSAIFMTIRNLVFGPRGGPKVKYVNYGYRKNKKSNVPTIIVHSPAAFVKQPFHLVHHHKKPIHHDPPPPPPFHHHAPLPKFHHHIHHESIIHHEPEIYHDSPASFTNHGDTYDEYQTLEYSEYPDKSHKRVEVINDGGQLDGKKRVRIRIPEENGPSMKEVLHRIRTIENERNELKPSVQYDYWEGSQTGLEHSSVDNTPWTVSDHHSASHTSNGSRSPNAESEDYVISYDKNEFTPMRTYPKKTNEY